MEGVVDVDVLLLELVLELLLVLVLVDVVMLFRSKSELNPPLLFLLSPPPTTYTGKPTETVVYSREDS